MKRLAIAAVGLALVVPAAFLNLLVIPLAVATVVLCWPPKLLYYGLAILRRRSGTRLLDPVVLPLYFLNLALVTLVEVLAIIIGFPYGLARRMTGDAYILHRLVDMHVAVISATRYELLSFLGPASLDSGLPGQEAVEAPRDQPGPPDLVDHKEGGP